MRWRSWQSSVLNLAGGRRVRMTPARLSAILLAAALSTLLASGCSEHGALPTLPALGEADGDWQRIYPAITGNSLLAAWGMDADDVWFTGNRGTILHYDGRTVRPFASPSSRTLTTIHGSARDDVWAISNSEIIHWNGRDWRQVPGPSTQSTDLTSICCLASDEVYLGGQSWQPPHGPIIWRHDGQAWLPMQLENITASNQLRRIWHPGPGYPLLAATENAIYRLEGETWKLLHPSLRIQHVSADLILATAADDYETRSLFRIHPDGRLDRLCTGALLGYARLILPTWQTLISYYGEIAHLDTCLPHWLLDTSFTIRDLIQPELPGLAARHAFAVGPDAGLLQLTWEADHSLSARSLLVPEENRQPRELIAADEILHFLDQDGVPYRCSGTAWQRLEAPFTAHMAQGLQGGALAICYRFNPTRIAVYQADGQWLELPPFESSSIGFWIDSELRPRLLTRNRDTDLYELWGLEAMVWTRLSVLAEDLSALDLYPRDLVGFSPDDLYLRADILLENDQVLNDQLLHFDGDRVRLALPGHDLRIHSQLRVGQHSGRLYLAGHDGAHGFSGYLLDGELTQITNHYIYWNKVVEADAERVFYFSSNRLYQLGAAGWEEFAAPGQNNFQDLWAHPEQGLFLLIDYKIHHRDLPGGVR